MAIATNLIRYSKDLSFKLGDAVSQGTEDGELFSAELRLKYLARAMNRLRRSLGAIMPESITDVFSDFYKTAGGLQIINGSVDLTNLDVFQIYDIYVKTSSNAINDDDDTTAVLTSLDSTSSSSVWTTYQANYILPENYFRVKYGDGTEYYLPNETDGRFYYTIIDNRIKFLPESTTGTWYVDMFYRNNIEVTSYEGTSITDIRLPYDYIDLLLTTACEEAMYDLGDNKALNKAAVYNGDIQRQISLLISRAQADKIEETNRTT